MYVENLIYGDTRFNDKTQSIQLGKHTKAVFYSDDGFHGNSFETIESIGCLDDNWIDTISSAEIKKFVGYAINFKNLIKTE